MRFEEKGSGPAAAQDGVKKPSIEKERSAITRVNDFDKYIHLH